MREPICEEIEDLLKMILSNICSPEKFPNQFGSLNDSITHILKLLQTPEETDQLIVL